MIIFIQLFLILVNKNNYSFIKLMQNSEIINAKTKRIRFFSDFLI